MKLIPNKNFPVASISQTAQAEILDYDRSTELMIYATYIILSLWFYSPRINQRLLTQFVHPIGNKIFRLEIKS